MSRLLVPSPEMPTMADLLEQLGGIGPERVRLYPLPGTATEADVAEIEATQDRLCELVDGVLVEKPMGYRESMIASAILAALHSFVMARKLGAVTGEAGMMQLCPGLVRIPDVAFVSRERLPEGRAPREAVPQLVPDLAVEVLSASNTAAEMDRKCREYFEAGVRLVWLVDPQTRSVKVFEGVDRSTTLSGDASLDGGQVLPGLALGLTEVFADVE